MRRTRAWLWTGSFEPSPSVAKASSALLVYVLIIHLLYDISYTMSSKTLHSLKTDAHAKSLPTEADIRPVAYALSFPLLMSLSLELGLRRLVPLDPRRLLPLGGVVARRHRPDTAAGDGWHPATPLCARPL